MQSKSDFAAWLRLQLTPGVGAVASRRLLAAFSLPELIFEQSYSALRQVVSDKQAQALLREPLGWAAAQDTLTQWLSCSGQFLLTLGDADYPQSLLCSPDPPLCLYVQCADRAWWQNWAALEQAPLIGMVGSRQPSAQGLRIAQDWAQSLAEGGLSVISGLALGVDAAAHQGALQAPAWGAGRSIAVVGTGLDSVYPRQHAALAQAILDAGGAMLSEFPLGTAAVASNFPKRNRIIAGLGLGVVVVEAALQSGSLITARLAMEANREVFALPGSIYAPQSKGCHALIKQGAQLVETVQEVQEALGFLPVAATTKTAVSDIQNTIKKGATQAALTPRNTKNTHKNAEKIEATISANAAGNADAVQGVNQEVDAHQKLLQALGFHPCTLDALVLQLACPAAQLQMDLLHLELAGKIDRLPGGLYQRRN